MNGGSTIGVPLIPAALPNIPQCPRTEAESARERRGRIATRARRHGHVVILKGTLVDGARIGTGQALGPRARGREGGILVDGGREANGGE
jgi:hypothetical protein